MRKVVIPAYARLAARFTRRERNDFYLMPESLHGLERLGWAAAGVVLGAFVVWAPFIPLWAKEWILVFGIAGLVFPDIRRLLTLRRYECELNRLVGRADDEIWRHEMALLTSGEMTRVAGTPEGALAAEAEEQAQRLREATVTPPP